jgi:hypothetical protein
MPEHFGLMVIELRHQAAEYRRLSEEAESKGRPVQFIAELLTQASWRDAAADQAERIIAEQKSRGDGG